VQVKERQVERPFNDNSTLVEGKQLTRQLSDGGRLETWQYVAYGVGVATLAGAITTFALGGWPWASEPVAVAPVAASGSFGGMVRVGF
jgi:hypothetical protein